VGNRPVGTGTTTHEERRDPGCLVQRGFQRVGRRYDLVEVLVQQFRSPESGSDGRAPHRPPARLRLDGLAYSAPHGLPTEDWLRLLRGGNQPRSK
jgi:hypothetical protein